MGGVECERCGKKSIDFQRASILAKYAYERGLEDSRIEFMAYGYGVKEVIGRYGKKYVLDIVNKES